MNPLRVSRAAKQYAKNRGWSCAEIRLIGETRNGLQEYAGPIHPDDQAGIERVLDQIMRRKSETPDAPAD